MKYSSSSTIRSSSSGMSSGAHHQPSQRQETRQTIELMERETGIEPATSSLGSWRSTAELLPLTHDADFLRIPLALNCVTVNPTKSSTRRRLKQSACPGTRDSRVFILCVLCD